MRVSFVLLLVMFLSLTSRVFAMENEDYKSDKKLSAYAAIVINDFDVKHVDIEHIDADEMKKLEPMMPKLVAMITDTIQKKLKDDKKEANIIVNGKEEPKNAVRLEGKIVKFNGGIGGVKYLLGFMTPKNAQTYISIAGRLVEVETGKELATFTDMESGKWFGKNFEDYFPELAETLGEHVAEFLQNNYD